jgi:transcriptional regulator with XRE-family HTH domain
MLGDVLLAVDFALCCSSFLFGTMCVRRLEHMTPNILSERNYIFNMRRNRRLLQKHLAVLLGHKHAVMISKYERGASLPPLQSAILLEIALGARLPELYPDLYRRLSREMLVRARLLPVAIRRDLRSRVLGKDNDDRT